MGYMRDANGRRLDTIAVLSDVEQKAAFGSPRPVPQAVVYIGDSITANGYGTTATGHGYYRSRGFWVWGQIRSHQRLALRGQLGVAGERLDQIDARFAAATALLPAGGIIHLLGGTNDVAQNRTLAQIQASVTSMLDKADAAGCRVILGTIPPRTSNTVAQNTVLLSANEWLRSLTTSRRNVLVADYYVDLVNAAGTFDTAADSGDGTHPNSIGAARMGKRLGDLITATWPYVDRISAAALDASAALALARPNIHPNPLMTGTAGGVNNGFTGSAATGWSTRHASGGTITNATASKVARTDGIAGEWQQVAVAGGTGVSRFRGPATTGFATGNVIQGVMEISEDPGAVGLTSSHVMFQCVNSGFVPVATAYGLFLDTGDAWPTEYPIVSGVVATPEVAIPATTVTVELEWDRGSAATYTTTHRVGRTVVRRLA
jgi:lysophospholipase L1-like esterase